MSKLYYCPYCGEIYNDIEIDINQEYVNCPKGSCYGTIFEVDENMVYIIKILNEKGYDTKYHCAGHAFQDYSYDKEHNLFLGSYIIFDRYAVFSEEVIEKLPKNWTLKEYELRLSLPFDKSQYGNQYANAILHAAILNELTMLLKWVIDLPFNEGIE